MGTGDVGFVCRACEQRKGVESVVVDRAAFVALVKAADEALYTYAWAMHDDDAAVLRKALKPFEEYAK